MFNVAEVFMADPVMSNLPLRRVLDCVEEKFQTRAQIGKIYTTKHPIEAWIHFSNAMRKRVFKEEREANLDGLLEQLVKDEYVFKETRKYNSLVDKKRFFGDVSFYKLRQKGIDAKASIKRRL